PLALAIRFARFIVTFLIGLTIVMGCNAKTILKIKDLPVDTFDPDLKVMESYSIPYWINSDLVVVSAMKRGAELTFPQANTPARVM
ncbi:hypothetical protein, partial [Erwinia amylovora]|uniref:hypothetical protein n=1 Tax=Erwinia amylovora TaxID=552 RepID=UPI0020BE3C13